MATDVNTNADRRASIRAKAGKDKEAGWDNLFCTNKEAGNGHILGPMRSNKKGLIFPYTPLVTHVPAANWSAQVFSHSNYSFNSWENSDVGELAITAEFTAHTEEEAKYVLAVTHFLKGSMKGGFGLNDEQRGVPPGVYVFNYLGDYQFKNIPVVFTSVMFNYDKDVDYVPVTFNDIGNGTSGATWIPVFQTITIQLRPQYNVARLRDEFTLTDFRNGKFLTGDGQGGYI